MTNIYSKFRHCRSFFRGTFFTTASVLAAGLLSSLAPSALAQYTVTNLVSNQNPIGAKPGRSGIGQRLGHHVMATSPFWVSDNGTGLSTLYNSLGQKQKLVVTVPPAGGTAPGTPTGVIGNTTGQFNITLNNKTASPLFIFATADGTIKGWNPNVDPTHAILGADRSGAGASYTALAIATNEKGENFIYAADNSANQEIDMFDSNFNFVMSFSDPSLQKKFAPYGMREINGKLWVTFTPLNKGQDGAVDIFNPDEPSQTRRRPRPAPFPLGTGAGSPNFGPLSNAVLIGNNDKEGRINAFDPTNGTFLGTLRDTSGAPISINQLWDWISAREPVRTAPPTNSSSLQDQITMPTACSASSL